MILDIIAVVILLFCIIQGIRKGFIKAFFKTASFIIAFILTVTFLNSAVTYVTKTSLGNAIYAQAEKLVGAESATLENSLTGSTQSDKGKTENDFLMKLIDLDEIKSKADEAKESLAQKAGDVMLKAVCAVGLFLALLILLRIIEYILENIAKLPVINGFNRMGGFIAGTLNGFILLFIFSCLLVFLISTSFAGEFCREQLKESTIMAFLYNNNPIF
ncbi:MAG: CvpA family protein [Bacillota bacterium]|nr:CvpA family protein [Bacillota bacterium]